MTSSSKDKALFRYLLTKSLDGTITQEEMAEFNQLLSDFPDLKDYYLKCVHIQLALHDQKTFVNCKQNGCGSQNDLHLLEEFGEYEKTAPAIQLDPKGEDLRKEIIQKVIYEKRHAQLNKGSLAAALISVAAVLVIIVLVQFMNPKTGLEVATLADHMNAKWADAAASMKNGTRLVTGGESLLLRSGIAQLRFDNNAMVTVEGPAEFSIISEDRIKLLYGRLYSSVPQEAIGFSVVTPKAIVIDLGTQFGVQVDFQGTTELHVTKGKTTLVAGEQKNKVSLEVSEGAAQRVSGLASVITEIPCNETVFVRAIDSHRNFIWRGEPAVDLADVIGGGNGLGTGRFEVGINPATGKLGETMGFDRNGERKYVSVPDNHYIDGVFVPDGTSLPVQISSDGHTFAECPPTNNVFFTEIINSKVAGEGSLWTEMAAGTGIYGTTTCPGIFMHANLGLTFDLDVLRADYEGAKLTSFIAEVGLSPAATRDGGNVDAWVLVDGEVRYCQKNMKEKGKTHPIRVELKSTDRFLTLITTDGGDVDYMEEGKRATDSDWAFFVRPRLELAAE